MLISERMSSNLVTITPDETVSLAARLLYRHNLGALPVCREDGSLVGIVTDRDIVLRCVAVALDPEQTAVRELMSRQVHTVAPHESTKLAAQLMAEKQVRRLPVVSKGKVLGMLSLGDLAKTRGFDMEAAMALTEISDNMKRK